MTAKATGKATQTSKEKEPTISKGDLPTGLDWRRYRKTAETSAARIEGPFVVETSEGTLRCEDGYLAIDARGYPYPIAVDEFHMIYAAIE